MKSPVIQKVVIILIFLATLGYMALTCKPSKPAVKPADLAVYMDPGYWKNQALREIIPFWEKTIDRTNGGFYDDVMWDGTVDATNGKYPRMISRIVFGFSTAYLLSGDDKYLEYARYGLDYLTNYGWDHVNGGWNFFIETNNHVKDVYSKNMFDEVYGNLGPVFYYIATGDKNALSYVGKTHDLIQSHVWDSLYGGYISEVNTNWEQLNRMKTFNAEMDTCSAYLIYYYLATRKPGLLRDLSRIADIAIEHMVDRETGFVGEYFDDDWKSKDMNLWVGHNLKTGWVLMRMYYLTGDKKYADTAELISGAMLKYNWDRRYYGWFFRFNRTNVNSNDEGKDWWTQEEGNVLMENLYRYSKNPEYLDRFRECSYFWDKYIIDHEYGDCYPEVGKDGERGPDKKAYTYKSAYHVMEHALFNYLYLSLYAERKEAALYFRLSSEKGGDRHYVKLVEDPAVIIKRVEIDGRNWNNFSPAGGYVVLPRGRGMKVKVTFEAGGK